MLYKIILIFVIHENLNYKQICDRFIFKILSQIKESSTRKFKKSKFYINFVLYTYLISIYNILINIVFILVQDFNIILCIRNNYFFIDRQFFL